MKKILIGFLAVCAVVFIAYKILQPTSDELDLATTRTTSEQHFSVSIAPENPDFRYNSLHSWIATITSDDGTPVESATLTIDGSMPMHDHGLPTSPQMTEYLGEGRYKIEGMQFHMQGLWELKLLITAGSISDTVTFNLVFLP